MNDELKAWAASPGRVILSDKANKVLSDAVPDSPGLAVLVEVIADDQMRHVAGGVGTHQPHSGLGVVIHNVN